MTNPIVMERKQKEGDVIRTVHCYWCPGCDSLHCIAILPDRQSNGAGWSFTGTLECPTYAPSQLTKWKGKDDKEFVCHTYIREGNIEFLNDCTHALKEKTVPLPPLPDWFVKERHEED